MSRTLERDPGEGRASLLPRTALSAVLLGLLALAGVSPGGPRLAAADEDAPEAEGIQWVSGFEAGRAAAKRDGKLMFVYFGRHAPR